MADGSATFTLRGRVKWYDPARGYGFVIPDDGAPDVMVHAACLRASSRVTLPEGARVTLIAANGTRGMHAEELLDVEEPSSPSSQQPDPVGPGQPARSPAPEAPAGPLQPARVKWFDRQKGFGFASVFGVAEDAFVHMETVRRSGFHELTTGDGVAVRTTRGPRGLVVAELRHWESATQASDRV